MRLVSVRFLLVAVAGLFPWTGAKGQGYTQLTDVPTVYIETENGRSITSKEQYTKCTLIIVDGDSIATYPDTEIRGRGNSTWWNSDKKAYRIKFATKQKLLGRHFANARSWTLLANHGDKTMIRNALTYDLGRFMGMEFCPAARFVDVYLNGTYRGTYQISDQVQAHKRRIDINEEDGCILEVANENSREEPYITSSVFRIMYNVKNPKDDALTMQKRIAIGQWIEGMERAVKGNDFADPERGYRAYIDEQSLVNWYVGAEITGNIDALYSIYMWKDADEQRCTSVRFGTSTSATTTVRSVACCVRWKPTWVCGTVRSSKCCAACGRTGGSPTPAPTASTNSSPTDCSSICWTTSTA